MAEIKTYALHIVHNDNEVVKLFDDQDEAMNFVGDFEDKYNIKLKSDSIWSFICGIKSKSYAKGYKEARR